MNTKTNGKLIEADEMSIFAASFNGHEKSFQIKIKVKTQLWKESQVVHPLTQPISSN